MSRKEKGVIAGIAAIVGALFWGLFSDDRDRYELYVLEDGDIKAVNYDSAVGFVTDDDLPDIATTAGQEYFNRYPTPLLFTKQQKNGSFAAYEPIQDLFPAFGIQLVDVDGDGDIDIVAGEDSKDPGNGRLRTYFNSGGKGDELFQPVHKSSDVGGVRGIAAADANFDGIVDLAIATPGYRVDGKKRSVHLLQYDAKHQIYQEWREVDFTSDETTAHLLHYTDIDSDGHVDLVFGNHSFISINCGVSKTPTPVLGDHFAVTSPFSFKTLHSPHGNQLVFASAEGRRTGLYVSACDGTCICANELDLKNYKKNYKKLSDKKFIGMGVGDIDADGDQDIVAALNEVYLYRNDGEERFTEEKLDLPGFPKSDVFIQDVEIVNVSRRDCVKEVEVDLVLPDQRQLVSLPARYAGAVERIHRVVVNEGEGEAEFLHLFSSNYVWLNAKRPAGTRLRVVFDYATNPDLLLSSANPKHNNMIYRNVSDCAT